MHAHRISSILLTSVIAASAVAKSPPLVVTATTVAIVRASSGGMRLPDQVVDLAKHEVGEVDLNDPKITHPRRHLDDDELAAFRKAWQAIVALEAEKNS